MRRAASTTLQITVLDTRRADPLQEQRHWLLAMGVEKVGATHCSGDKAIAKMKEAFGDGFVRMGVGRVIQVGE